MKSHQQTSIDATKIMDPPLKSDTLCSVKQAKECKGVCKLPKKRHLHDMCDENHSVSSKYSLSYSKMQL